MGRVDFPDKQFVNSDVKTMALSLIAEANAISDEERGATARRGSLLRASAHLLSAFAEMQAMDIRPRS